MHANDAFAGAGTVPLYGATINLGLNGRQSLAALLAIGTVADALNNVFDLKTTSSPLTASRAEQRTYALTRIKYSSLPVYDIRYNRVSLHAPTSLLEEGLQTLKGVGGILQNPME